MFGKKAAETTPDDRLDRAARLVIRAAARADEEAEAAAVSPFLYARVRARIEERRRAETEEGWLAALVVAWRAVPAMALVAALAATLMLWFGLFGVQTAPQFNDEAFFEARGAGVESVVLADGSGQLSREEVFEIVVNRENVRR